MIRSRNAWVGLLSLLLVWLFAEAAQAAVGFGLGNRFTLDTRLPATQPGFATVFLSHKAIHFDDGPFNELPQVGERVQRSLIISNTGDLMLHIFALSMEDSAFSVSPDSGIVSPGDSLQVTVIYAPQTTGLDTTTLVIATNGPDGPENVPVFGATLGSIGPRMDVPSALDIGVVLLGGSERRHLVIENQGNIQLTVTSIVSDNAPFRPDRDSLVIEPDEKRVVPIVFSPHSEGEAKAILTLYSDDPVSPLVNVELRGIGKQAPEGPIAIDFSLVNGDQEQRIAGDAAPGKSYELQLNVEEAPEINGWSANIEYDPTQVRYVIGSFRASGFIPGMLVLVDEKEDMVGVGGTVLGTDARNAGDGTLGTLSFEVLESFADSTQLVITRVTFRRLDGVEDKRTVLSVATITSEPMLVEAMLGGDFNGDGKVDFDDFFLFADHFGTTPESANWDPIYDQDNDQNVNFDDFFLFADHFGKEIRAKLMALARAYLGLPISARLKPNFPNPFNRTTMIRYQLAETGPVRLDVFDLAGQRIRSLVDDIQEPGAYEISWDGTDDRGVGVSAGIFLMKLRTGDATDVGKMLLLK